MTFHSPAVVDRLPLTIAIKQLLLDGTGRPGDVGQPPRPEAGETAPGMPYWILYPLDGGGFTGPPAVPEADASIPYQVTSIGARYDQIEWCADRVRQQMFARHADGRSRIEAAGLTVMAVTSDFGLPGVDFDGPVGNAAERFVVWVTTSQ